MTQVDLLHTKGIQSYIFVVDRSRYGGFINTLFLCQVHNIVYGQKYTTYRSPHSMNVFSNIESSGVYILRLKLYTSIIHGS